MTIPGVRERDQEIRAVAVMVAVVLPIVPKNKVCREVSWAHWYMITLFGNFGGPRNAITVMCALEPRIVWEGLFISMLITSEDPLFQQGFFLKESPTGSRRVSNDKPNLT